MRWSSATLASFVADKIVESIHKDPNPSYNLTPVDGFDFDESKEDKAIDAGDRATLEQLGRGLLGLHYHDATPADAFAEVEVHSSDGRLTSP